MEVVGRAEAFLVAEEFEEVGKKRTVVTQSHQRDTGLALGTTKTAMFTEMIKVPKCEKVESLKATMDP